MGRSAVRVVARTRPTDHFAAQAIRLLDDGKTITVHIPRRATAAAVPETINNTPEDHSFRVDAILHDASQEAVFELCGSDLVKAALSGYNASLLCYGETGAGKTFTMIGGSDYRTRGLVPRALKLLFDEVQSQADRSFEVRVSFIEVYNEQIRDLLSPATPSDEIAVQEDAKGCVTVRGAEQRLCEREADALALLFEGCTHRAVAEHTLNPVSSRSHCLFTVHLVSRSRVESESATVVSKLHCIDLAGSERLSRTGSEGKVAKEAQYINKSLTFLEQVVMALATANRTHVPFRSSKLTSVLKDSLGGNSRTTMVANLWPEERHLGETLSTLHFAARMMRVQSDASVNVVVDPATQVRQLQRQVGELRAELQMLNQLAGKSHVAYEGDYSEDERFEMEKTVRAFVAASPGAPGSEIPVRSLREVREYFRVFKAFIDQRDAETRHAVVTPAAAAAAAAASTIGKSPPAALLGIDRQGSVVGGGGAQPSARGPGVGVVDKSAGVGVGVAAPSKGLKDALRAAAGAASSPQRGATDGGGSAAAAAAAAAALGSPSKTDVTDDSSVAPPSAAMAAGGGGEAPDKNAAFAEFKRVAAGVRTARSIREATDALTEAKRWLAEQGHAVNAAKHEIDEAAALLEQRRLLQGGGNNNSNSNNNDGSSGGGLVDDEEYALVGRVRAAKQTYREHYDALTAARTERDQAAKTVEAAKRQLIDEFERWYTVSYASTSTSQQQQQQARLVSPTSKAARAAAGGGGRRGDEPAMDADDLDEGERFEALELNRVLEADPDSLAYYTAKKMTQTRQAAAKASTFRQQQQQQSPGARSRK